MLFGSGHASFMDKVSQKTNEPNLQSGQHEQYRGICHVLDEQDVNNNHFYKACPNQQKTQRNKYSSWSEIQYSPENKGEKVDGVADRTNLGFAFAFPIRCGNILDKVSVCEHCNGNSCSERES